jgi:hypothetical protein
MQNKNLQILLFNTINLTTKQNRFIFEFFEFFPCNSPSDDNKEKTKEKGSEFNFYKFYQNLQNLQDLKDAQDEEQVNNPDNPFHEIAKENFIKFIDAITEFLGDKNTRAESKGDVIKKIVRVAKKENGYIVTVESKMLSDESEIVAFYNIILSPNKKVRISRSDDYQKINTYPTHFLLEFCK